MEDIQEILEDFLVEAFELIEQLDQNLVELEARPEDLELLNSIFRVAHTIKGSSSFLNFDVLTHLTHHMEDVLNKARHGELKLTHHVMDVVLESIDLMKALLHAIRDHGNDTSIGIDITIICARLDEISSGDSAPKAAVKPKEAPKVEVAAPVIEDDNKDYSKLSDEEVEEEIERLLKMRKEEDKKRREASGPAVTPAPKASVESVLDDEDEVKEEPIKASPRRVEAAAANTTPAKKEAASSMEQTIRVEVKRLDHLMNLIGELVLGKNRLLKIYDDVEERYEGEKFLEELNQVVSSISLVIKT